MVLQSYSCWLQKIVGQITCRSTGASAHGGMESTQQIIAPFHALFKEKPCNQNKTGLIHMVSNSFCGRKIFAGTFSRFCRHIE
jgi:hypothetical protein